eukprot:TRINITY_DN12015_c0_g1_i3.p1 TRINITY_DN12015_c0_g1~~TRINITY_DN12015_c0_g1_i3.p1  ORF type:complete len:215 (-),score=27.09 TRINITY_DN12015_c0_g1_i3:16-579(-)
MARSISQSTKRDQAVAGVVAMRGAAAAAGTAKGTAKGKQSSKAGRKCGPSSLITGRPAAAPCKKPRTNSSRTAGKQVEPAQAEAESSTVLVAVATPPSAASRRATSAVAGKVPASRKKEQQAREAWLEKAAKELMEGPVGHALKDRLPLRMLTRLRAVAWQWTVNGKTHYPVPIGSTRPLSPFSSDD